MKNFLQEGDVIRATAPYAVLSGVGMLVGSLFGVTQAAAAISTPVDIAVEGVFVLAKATGAAWTEGARIYWDDTAKNCTTTASTNKLIGVAVMQTSGVMPASGDTTGTVRLSAAFTL
jgi:predicted RecA/RadA family phage recombinase